MLGSHNSMTFLRPTKWWMRMINLTSRCQSKTLQHQYDSGVRYFDFRVKIVDNKGYKYAHGVLEYKTLGYDIFSFISRYDGIICRIILEKGNKDVFRSWMDRLLSHCSCNIHYIIDDKKTWHVYKYGNSFTGQPTVIDNYPTYPKDGLIPFPCRHNKRYPAPTMEQINDPQTVILCDFV